AGRRPARDPGDARPCRPLDDADLYPRAGSPAAAGLRCLPPAPVIDPTSGRLVRLTVSAGAGTGLPDPKERRFMGRIGRHLFTSESVTAGHPDKIADPISDGVLDAILAQDPSARVACETLVTTGLAVIAGEITTTGSIDYQRVVREVIRDVGYTRAKY